MGFLVLSALVASALFPALLYREEAPSWRALPATAEARLRRGTLLAAWACAVALLLLRVPLADGDVADALAVAAVGGSSVVCARAWWTGPHARLPEAPSIGRRVVRRAAVATAAIVATAVLLNPALGWEAS